MPISRRSRGWLAAALSWGLMGCVRATEGGLEVLDRIRDAPSAVEWFALLVERQVPHPPLFTAIQRRDAWIHPAAFTGEEPVVVFGFTQPQILAACDRVTERDLAEEPLELAKSGADTLPAPAWSARVRGAGAANPEVLGRLSAPWVESCECPPETPAEPLTLLASRVGCTELVTCCQPEVRVRGCRFHVDAERCQGARKIEGGFDVRTRTMNAFESGVGRCEPFERDGSWGVLCTHAGFLYGLAPAGPRVVALTAGDTVLDPPVPCVFEPTRLSLIDPDAETLAVSATIAGPTCASRIASDADTTRGTFFVVSSSLSAGRERVTLARHDLSGTRLAFTSTAPPPTAQSYWAPVVLPEPVRHAGRTRVAWLVNALAREHTNPMNGAEPMNLLESDSLRSPSPSLWVREERRSEIRRVAQISRGRLALLQTTTDTIVLVDATEPAPRLIEKDIRFPLPSERNRPPVAGRSAVRPGDGLAPEVRRRSGSELRRLLRHTGPPLPSRRAAAPHRRASARRSGEPHRRRRRGTPLDDRALERRDPQAHSEAAMNAAMSAAMDGTKR